jgi:hypothetical protein
LSGPTFVRRASGKSSAVANVNNAVAFLLAGRCVSEAGGCEIEVLQAGHAGSSVIGSGGVTGDSHQDVPFVRFGFGKEPGKGCHVIRGGVHHPGEAALRTTEGDGDCTVFPAPYRREFHNQVDVSIAGSAPGVFTARLLGVTGNVSVRCRNQSVQTTAG